MKKIYVVFMVGVLVLALDVRSIANHIVYPWRACPAIVPVGTTIEILYDNLFAMPVDSIILKGPYNQVVLSADTVMTGKFEYDSFTRASVSNVIRVTVPEGTPEELYDLIVTSGGETSISKRSVKVLKAYRDPHRFIHITDPHVSRQWIGTPGNGYAKELELLDRFIEVANIICPEYIIVTGDIIHDYTRFDADSLGWGGIVRSGFEHPPLAEEKYKNYFEGANGFTGIYGFNAPVFSLPGNHDFYGPASDDYPAKAAQWNRLMGKRVYGFSYKDTRVIAADDYLGDPVVDIPAQALMSGLQGRVLDGFLTSAGPGKIRIMAQHRPDRVDTTFLNRHRIAVLLNGHSHRPHQEFVGSTPTLNIRPGVVCRSGEIANWEKMLGFFRVFTIDGDAFHYSSPLRFCQNPIAPPDQLVLNLTLTFKKNNNGRAKSNEAVITNHFDIDLPECRIRFIMPQKERGYTVSGGEVYQTIENPLFSVVDVHVDVKANSSKIVKIE
jgi:predicted MPP superfamily phosphohydrolase